MKWINRGKIFDPSEHQLPLDSVGFAQSPQALVLEDRVRIYFSTRERDATGKYISHVAFVDFEHNMGRVLCVNSTPVINLGGLGCFDEHGIFPFHAFNDGERILAYTTGWNRKVSVPADASVGLAISHDKGLTFQKYGSGPILAATLNEPFLVGDSFVVKVGHLYHMWYIFGLRWIQQNGTGSPERIYKIAHAVSTDGIQWQRNGRPLIADHLNVDECQALPTVINLDGLYHMYFCYREAYNFRSERKAGYKIGYAYSNDLVSWVRDDRLSGFAPSGDEWDSQMQCYPHAFKCKDKIYMLYNGNKFGLHGFGLAVLER